MIQDPTTRATGRSGELDWLLDDLVLRVHEVRHAVVLSNDGLAVGASTDLAREDAEHLAAVASGFHSLAKGTGHGGDGRRLPLRGGRRRRLLPGRPHGRHRGHRPRGL
jgi:hypothetical protein